MFSSSQARGRTGLFEDISVEVSPTSIAQNAQRDLVQDREAQPGDSGPWQRGPIVLPVSERPPMEPPQHGVQLDGVPQAGVPVTIPCHRMQTLESSRREAWERRNSAVSADTDPPSASSRRDLRSNDAIMSVRILGKIRCIGVSTQWHLT